MEDVLVMLILYSIIGWAIYAKLYKPIKEYNDIPKYKDYVRNNPEILSNTGVKCIHCGSPSIKSWGNQNAGDKNRIHICNKCGEKLYRTRL